MRRVCCCSALLVASLPSLALGQTTSASATITLVAESGGVYTYDLSLTDTGTTDIGTFWYSWMPGQDFMADPPFDIFEPTGWSLLDVTHETSYPDGYGILWDASTALTPGQTIDGFLFSSPDSLAMIQGDSIYYPGMPVNMSFVYEGGPFQGGSDMFTVRVTPGPPSFLPMMLGATSLLVRRRRQR